MSDLADILESRARMWRRVASEAREARDLDHARQCDGRAESLNVQARAEREAERVARSLRTAARARRPSYRAFIRSLLA